MCVPVRASDCVDDLPILGCHRQGWLRILSFLLSFEAEVAVPGDLENIEKYVLLFVGK